MAIKFEAVANCGTYTDKSGAEKKRYHNCGKVFETENGLSLKLESLPIGFNGWLNFYPPREKGERAAPAGGGGSTPQDKAFQDDDIPF